MAKTKKMRWAVSVGLLVCLVGSMFFAACGPAAPAGAEEALAAEKAKTAAAEKALAAEKAKTVAAEKQAADLQKKVAGMVEAPKVLKWRAQSHLPGGTAQYDLAELFCTMVKEMSDGQLDITLYPGGQLFAAPEGLDNVAKGVVEMCSGSASYWKGKVGPLCDVIFGLPYGYQNIEEGDCFWYSSTYRFIDMVRDAFAPHKVLFGGPFYNPAETQMFKEPCDTLAKMQGKKVRDIGMEAATYTQLGATVTYVTGPEIYTALATGVIDAAGWGGPKDHLDMKLCEVAKYLTWPPLLAVGEWHWLFSLEKFNALPVDLKAILESAIRREAQEYYNFMYDAHREAINEMTTEYGVTLFSLPPETKAAALRAWDVLAASDPLAGKAIDMMRQYMRFRGYID